MEHSEIKASGGVSPGHRTKPDIDARVGNPSRIPFTALVVAALVLGVGAAVLISPVAALGVAAAGFHFPFPRIFDRTVIITLLLAMLLFARALNLKALIVRGFNYARGDNFRGNALDPRGGTYRRALASAGGGLVLALVAMVILFAIASAMGAGGRDAVAAVVVRAARYALAAVVIAIIEESFFRAFLLGGMTRDFGRQGALVVSAAIYSLTHIVRAPAHYYLASYHPGAGLHNLALSAERLIHPVAALPTIVGLFLLGVVLGEAFLLTGTVYFSIGLHAGFVIGAKSWPVLGDHGARMPLWLAGTGPVPLIGGAAAWLMALIVMAILPLLLGRERAEHTLDAE
ncbi:MAG: lysostaphin resistance A-like protein [Candidatus Binataceae bacterium]